MQISVHADTIRRNEAYTNKKLQKKQVVVKSVMNSNSKRFRDIATRETFNLKTDPQMQKKTHSNR